MREAIQTGAKYLIALVVIVGAFLLIYQGRGDQVQPWTVIGLIVGWIIRDSAGESATGLVERVQQAQPTVTTTAGPPQRTVIEPSSVDRVG
jgi:hypothetical protein